MKNLLRKREAYLNEKWLDKEASEQFEIFVKYQEQMEEQGHKNRNSLDSIGYQYEELMSFPYRQEHSGRQRSS